MSFFQAILLGMIQGISEFLPISSSSHLKLARILMHIEHKYLFFDLICHAGTLLVVLIYFRKDIYKLLTTERKELLWLFLATLPLIPFYLLFKLFGLSDLPSYYLGCFLMVTSAVLFLANKQKKEKPNKKLLHALCIGAAQGFALLPGISRSAVSIATAKLFGWSNYESVRFSFLLSIPTIGGGVLLESYSLLNKGVNLPANNLSYCLIGLIFSLTFGLISISYAISRLRRGKFLPFAIYCSILGILIFLTL